ncbi:hypothetical protein KSP39_PZI019944 [Platanthera zijinensis]|uniref:Uncharacterized protein n=1 Tax=Platanthera zijinensis TaxID=2320716 RepID=A0AAP0AZZ8_9ASPA
MNCVEARASSTGAAAVATTAAHELADSNPTPPTDVRARVFSFRKSTALRLKSSTTSSFLDNTKPLSTFQPLTTNTWRSVSHARRLPPEVITIFAIFANCRLRIQPSVALSPTPTSATSFKQSSPTPPSMRCSPPRLNSMLDFCRRPSTTTTMPLLRGESEDVILH